MGGLKRLRLRKKHRVYGREHRAVWGKSLGRGQRAKEAKESKDISIRRSLVGRSKSFRKTESCLPGVSMRKDMRSGTQGAGAKSRKGGTV